VAFHAEQKAVRPQDSMSEEMLHKKEEKGGSWEGKKGGKNDQKNIFTNKGKRKQSAEIDGRGVETGEETEAADSGNCCVGKERRVNRVRHFEGSVTGFAIRGYLSEK